MNQDIYLSMSNRKFSEETLNEIALLDKAKYYMIYLIVATMMRYHYLVVSKQMLLDNTLMPETFSLNCYPDTFELQIVSSLLFLIALMGFYEESREVANQAEQAGEDTSEAETDLTLSETIITVSLIRFIRLLKHLEKRQGMENGINREEQESKNLI